MVWLRAQGTLPDEPLLHVCAVTYASDMTLLDAVQESPVATGVRGLAEGQTFQDGRLIASVVQEGFIRVSPEGIPANLVPGLATAASSCGSTLTCPAVASATD
jgi:acyl-CoA thioesterase